MIIRFIGFIFLFAVQLSVLSSTLEFSTLKLAAVEISHQPKQKSSYVFEKKNGAVKVMPNRKSKIIVPKKKIKKIEGYQTTIDRKGNRTRGYVYGEVEKGNQGVYTGYLYGKDNKKTYTYGAPSSGVMSTNSEYGADVTIESESKPDGHY